jgi:hypothetical protein
MVSRKYFLRMFSQCGTISRPIIAFSSLLFLFSTTTIAQWRIATPRDTLFVPANRATPVSGKFALTSGVDMWVQADSTFTELDASTTFGIDAAYTYLVNGSVLFPEAANPPTYGGKPHNYRLAVTSVPGLLVNSFAPIENSYQPNHVYTEHIPCQGFALRFQIDNDKTADFSTATGGIGINMARWTAGIAIENYTVSFSATSSWYIGQSYTQLDSLASYGVDPLQVDSIKILNATVVGDFSFISERTKGFTLRSEPANETNELKIIFTPSFRGTSTAELHIYSHNADPVSREKIILLNGYGIAPDFGVGPHQIDFGKVRINYPAVGFTNVSNAKGNTSLIINSNCYYNQISPVPPPNVFSFDFPAPPMTITPGSIGQIRTIFSPTKRIKYEGWLQVRGDNVFATDSVHLFGEGAEPIPVLSPVPKNGTLDFGYVYRGDTKTDTLILTNKGNWTCSVIFTHLYGPAFTFSPPDNSFIVEPDSSRIFIISFHPGTGTDSLPLRGYFVMAYDDYVKDTVILTGTEIEPPISSCNTIYDFGKIRIGVSRTDSVSCLTNESHAFINLQEEDVLPSGEFKEVGRIGGLGAKSVKPIYCNFDPIIPGPASAYFYYEANNKRDSILLTGIGAVAKAIFTPLPVNFGVVPSNTTQKIIATLKDSGDFPLIVDSIRIVGDTSFHIFYTNNGGVTPLPPDTIQPDSLIPIEVRFENGDLTGRVHLASVCVYYNDGTKDCFPLEGIEEAQYLQFAQGSINFGKRRIKTHDTLPGVFRNGSNITLSIGAATVTPLSGPFNLLDTLNPVKAQSHDSVLVDFFPQVRGMYTGYLHAFGSNIKTDSIILSGQGAAPIPSLSDSELNFGIVTLFTKSLPKTLTLFNSGDWFLKVLDIQIVGDKYKEFNVKKGNIVITTDSIPEQNKSQYAVTFSPNHTIVYHTAKLVFTYDDGTEGVVILKGFDESPKMVLDVDSIDFGKVRIGTPPSQYIVNMVSTAKDTLTATNIQLITSAPAGTFTMIDGITNQPVVAPVRIVPKFLYPINISFTPQARGQFSAFLIFTGSDFTTSPDTVFITGVGGAPVPILSATTLDFGSLFAGYPGTRSFTLADSGNWILSIKNTTITGPNNADFTLRNMTPQFDIAENNMNTFTVDFKATTPYQAAQRIAQLIFTVDDSSKLTVNLIEQDITPIPIELRMDKERARLGDYVTPCLRLIDSLPDTLNIIHLKGVINYDPTIVVLDRTGIQLGDMLIQLGNWNLTTNAADPLGTITYDLTGTTKPLSTPGSLLRLKFSPRAGDNPGSSSPLANAQFSFPLRTELAPQAIDGVIIIDSACGNTHLLSGPATANMVDQNMPNPFGKNASGETQIPFDIGFNNTPVTIRILDISGREIARPVDNVVYNQGRYTAPVSATALASAGTYFYEFRAGDAQPVYKKMVVNK